MSPESMRHALRRYNIKEISDDIGVNKMTVYRFINGAPASKRTKELIRDFLARESEALAKAAEAGDE